jgi:VanZ family protein
MGVIFYASSIPASNIPPLFPFQDIAFHLFIYCLLAYFFSRALKNTYSGLIPSRIIVFAIVFCIIYGITDEFHQAFVPGRTPSGLDVFIDGVGSFIGSMVAKWLR